ncbi:MAG: galactose mutarotase [Anaerotignum sp.]|nr:galactose mutarotase [Anaerotignum sp.]MBR6542432.1 galactose mutarotase [Anaerotignum sp.]
MKMWKEPFGTTCKGEAVVRWWLENKNGTKAAVLTYGATLQSLIYQGTDVVLGFDDMEGYEAQDAYVGAVIGRYANRIGAGKFELNGKTYDLFINNGPNHLHGGKEGFDKKIWRVEEQEDGLHLFYTSLDGEENYPGTLEVEVCYQLDEEDGLHIIYTAKADKDTVLNLTNHAYFNLNGHQNGSLENHKVRIFADYFTENDENCLPTGEILPVTGTPMDFREMQTIMARIAQDDVQLKRGNGYDHNWIIDGEGFRICAEAVGEITKIKMETLTDQPGMQFYTANYLAPDKKGKDDADYCPRSAFCFETQGFPNATAFTHFPSPVLRVGEVYRRKTIYRLTQM